MTLGSKAPDSNAFLFALMDKLELVRGSQACSAVSCADHRQSR